MDWVIDALQHLQFWHWLALGLGLLLAELVTGSTYLLWPAVAAWITGLALMVFGVTWPVQLIVFALATVALLLFARPLVKNRLLMGPDTDLNEPGRQLIGARAIAAQSFANGEGRVRLGDTEWRAVSAEPLAAGDEVVIVSVEGTTLGVRKL
jgi:membrane protein implicated in regulation of membrane protease activity